MKVIYDDQGVAGVELHQTLYSPAALATLARDLDNERQAHAALRALVGDLCAAVTELQAAHVAEQGRLKSGSFAFSDEGRTIAERLRSAHKRLIAAAIAIQAEAE